MKVKKATQAGTTTAVVSHHLRFVLDEIWGEEEEDDDDINMVM